MSFFIKSRISTRFLVYDSTFALPFTANKRFYFIPNKFSNDLESRDVRVCGSYWTDKMHIDPSPIHILYQIQMESNIHVIPMLLAKAMIY